MRVLVVIEAARGCNHVGGCGAVDGELATLLTVRHRWQDGTGRLTETDHVLGIETGHLATAAAVVDIDVPREVIVDSIEEALRSRARWDDIDVALVADQLAAVMLELAAQYPEGSVLERCGDGPRLHATSPGPAPDDTWPQSIPPTRRPICEHHRRLLS